MPSADNFDDALDTLDRIDPGNWHPWLLPLLNERFSPRAHGDMPRWIDALDRLPQVRATQPVFDADAVATGPLSLTPADRTATVQALEALSPWRKGPFEVDDILIDSEWRSNLKWARVEDALGDIRGRRVLDVGCGNGYYAFRLLGVGADAVIGIDPTLLYVQQFRAIRHFLAPVPAHVLPLRLDDLPAGAAFDVALSMGVLYHSRAPIDQLRHLKRLLRPGGKLVLETLVLPGGEAYSRTPPSRYARMRNVWHLPTIAELEVWVKRAGFRGADLLDVSVTSVDEQRRTAWMPFESLAEALDPADSALTVEGWPRPTRAVLVARTQAGG